MRGRSEELYHRAHRRPLTTFLLARRPGLSTRASSPPAACSCSTTWKTSRGSRCGRRRPRRRPGERRAARLDCCRRLSRFTPFARRQTARCLVRDQPLAQAVVVRGGCLWCIDRPCPRSTRPTSMSRVPTASPTHLPAAALRVNASCGPSSPARQPSAIGHSEWCSREGEATAVRDRRLLAPPIAISAALYVDLGTNMALGL